MSEHDLALNELQTHLICAGQAVDWVNRCWCGMRSACFWTGWNKRMNCADWSWWDARSWVDSAASLPAKPSRRHTGHKTRTGFIIQVQIWKPNLQNSPGAKPAASLASRGRPPPVDAGKRESGGSIPPDQPVESKPEHKQPSTISLTRTTYKSKQVW